MDKYVRILFLILLAATITATASCSVSEQENPALVIDDPVFILQLLNDSNYKKLELILGDLISLSEENIKNEIKVLNAFHAFSNTSKKTEVSLNSWVKTNPKSYLPYLARSMFYLQKAWNARGNQFIKDTSQSQLKEMEHFLNWSLTDTSLSIKHKNNLTLAYANLIEISKILGERDKFHSLYKKAIKSNPNSFIIRSAYASGLRARWGGSDIDFEKFLNSSIALSSKNNNLKYLKSYPFAELGYKYSRAKMHTESIDSYSRAIEIFPSQYHYAQRGREYAKAGKPALALSDFNSAIKMRPYNNPTVESRAYCYLTMKKPEKALSDADILVERDPSNPFILHLRGLALLYLGKANEGEASLRQALELDPNNKAIEKMHDRALSDKAYTGPLKSFEATCPPAATMEGDGVWSSGVRDEAWSTDLAFTFDKAEIYVYNDTPQHLRCWYKSPTGDSAFLAGYNRVRKGYKCTITEKNRFMCKQSTNSHIE